MIVLSRCGDFENDIPDWIINGENNFSENSTSIRQTQHFFRYYWYKLFI